MKKLFFVILIPLGFFWNAATYALPPLAGLLTDDFGILKLNDFDEKGQLSKESHFPHDDFENYWQCLKPEKIFMKCTPDGRSEPEGWINGNATVKIYAGGKIYNFGTRRNWDMEFCRDMIFQIRSLTRNENAVCIFASFLSKTENQSKWVIDRVKTKRGEWSWFARSGEK